MLDITFGRDGFNSLSKIKKVNKQSYLKQQKSNKWKPLLVACDVYRPAAIKQLQVNGEKQGVDVFSMGDGHNPVNIAKAAIEHATDIVAIGGETH